MDKNVVFGTDQVEPYYIGEMFSLRYDEQQRWYWLSKPDQRRGVTVCVGLGLSDFTRGSAVQYSPLSWQPLPHLALYQPVPAGTCYPAEWNNPPT